MKVTSNHKGVSIQFKSYSSFYKWCETNKLFATKNGAKDFTQNTSKVIYRQKDGTALEVTKTI